MSVSVEFFLIELRKHLCEDFEVEISMTVFLRLKRFGFEELFEFENFDEWPAFFEGDRVCGSEIFRVYFMGSAFKALIAHLVI